jgi:hypothetical protein
MRPELQSGSLCTLESGSGRERLMQGIEIGVKNALTNLPPLTQASIIAELRPERDLAGAFSFLVPDGNGTTHPHISRANQRIRPMIRISSAVRS